MADEEKTAPAQENPIVTEPPAHLSTHPTAEPAKEPETAPEAPDAALAAEDRATPIRPAPVAIPVRRGGFVAPFLGGAAAAVIGFGLSHYNIFGLRADPDSARITSDLARLESRLDTEGKTAAAASKAAGDQALAAMELAQDGRAAAEEGVAALTARLDGIAARIEAQAQALPDGSIPPAAFAALKGEVEALKSTLQALPAAPADHDALRQQIAAELDARAAEITAEAEREAEATRQAALRDAAWIALEEAVRTGQPYDTALNALDLRDVPASLADHAASGLPGLTQLAESFPEAARSALDLSLRAEEAGGLGDRALSLLRVTTGQRSLTPQEGSDPDAVLSRAEAAVKAGDLPAALHELQALPPEGIAAMTSWSAEARSRIDAEAALAALKP